MNARASIRLAVVAVIAACAHVAPAAVMLPSPQEHSSLPGAPATLYLNFLGDHTDNFGSWSNFDTPAYDVDGDTSTFNSQELSNIDHIWSGVEEKFSPFNLNVTTVDPGTRNDGHVFVVDVGGTGSWTGGLSGGISDVGGLLDGNGTAFVFSKNLANGLAKYTAEAAAHEAGHGFGLRHQSTYDGNRNKIEEYNSNNHSTALAPIMGTSYAALRGLWWYGPSVSLSVFQDDMATISRTGNFTNNFGYRPDDHPNVFPNADPANVASDLAITAQGVIEQNTDVDIFKFVTPGGLAQIFADANPDNPMLDMSLKLMDSAGNILQTSAHPATSDPLSLREYLQMNLDPGQYEIAVSSAAINEGDVGQYFITGFVAPEPAVFGLLGAGGLMMIFRRARGRRGRSTLAV